MSPLKAPIRFPIVNKEVALLGGIKAWISAGSFYCKIDWQAAIDKHSSAIKCEVVALYVRWQL